VSSSSTSASRAALLIRRRTDDANNLIDAQQCLQQPLHNMCPRFYLIQQMRRSKADRMEPKIKKAFECRSEGESLRFIPDPMSAKKLPEKLVWWGVSLCKLLNIITAATASRFNSMTTESNNSPGTPTLPQLDDTHLLCVPS
jgi:hypothetical protein